jgi:hypothetical protein
LWRANGFEVACAALAASVRFNTSADTATPQQTIEEPTSDPADGVPESRGSGYQTRINAVLQAFKEAML